MKIQLIGHGKEHDPKSSKMRWHRLPLLFEKQGHNVDHILVQDWKKFYFRYLKFKPDVLISAGVIGVIPAFLKKIKMIRKPLVHDWNDDYTDAMGKIYGIDRIAFLEHFIIKNSDFITTPSRFLQKKCKLFGMDAKYIPHGVSSDFTKDKPYKLDGKINVAYVGSQTEYKMVDKIIESAKGLDCDLYLFGKTNEKFKKLAGDNVHFMGLIDQNEISKYIRAADILIFAADDDCTLKMYEYIKSGKAILCLKGRPGYILDNNFNALLVDDLGEGLKKLIMDKKLRESLSRNIRKFEVKTWEEIGKDYLKFLESIINR